MTGPPPLRVVAALLAGRVAFRGALVVSAPLLLGAWGPDDFGPYAVAVGSTLVLNPLVGSGTEKSAGTLLPRAHRRDVLLAAHLLTAAVIAGGSLLLAVPLAVAEPHRAALWLLAGAVNVGFGAVQAVVAYRRVLGTPLADPAGFGLLAAVTAAGVGLAVAGRMGPLAYLALQAGAAGFVAATLTVGLRRRLARPRRRTVLLVARATVLMGANTLLATAPFSIVVAVLGGHSDAGTVSRFYLALVAYTVLGNVLDYLQRVYQPWLTTALLTRPGRVLGGGRRAGRLARDLLAPAGALAVGAAAAWLDPLVGALAGMLAIAPVLVAAALLTWLLENGATAALGRTTRAGLIGLITTAAAALLLVPPLTAAGAVLALLAGATVQIGLLVPSLSIRSDTHDSRPAQPVRAGRPAPR